MTQFLKGMKMAFAPKPVKIIVTDTYDGSYEPAELLAVGGLPVAPADVVNLTAVPASFADLAAVRTYLDTLVTELKSSKSFN